MKRFLLIALPLYMIGCSPEERCYRDEDCAKPMVCSELGMCTYLCGDNKPCAKGFICMNHECHIHHEGGISCPDDMAAIADSYCMDRYEASRPDATASSAGTDSSRAMSRAGVIPWQVGGDNAAAQAACAAAGKRLCTAQEWEFACKGVNGTVYGYGDTYDPKICNGIDTFGNRTGFHVVPVGSFPNCNNGWGVYDMSGNVWEHTADGSAKTVRGGAYNCSDSRTNHQCSYVPRTWSPAALGFRCCSDGEAKK